MATLEARISSQASLIDRKKRKIQKLSLDNEALAEELKKHKRDHIETKIKLTKVEHRLQSAEKEIADLNEALRIAKLPANSSNSSRPPSTDLFKPKRSHHYNHREKTGRKPGGQPGHKGATLQFCSDTPNREIEHTVAFCSACGKDLSSIAGERAQTHQVVDIAVPKRILINHITITKYCSCGYCNEASFPDGAKGPVNYGSMVRGLVANLSVRQYMPYKRTVELMKDIFGVPMSQGTVTNLLKQFVSRARGEYQDIQEKILHSPVVGADETGVKVNGIKGWMHVYQTPEHTLIGYHPSRGKEAQDFFYPEGLPNSTLVTDCLAMQLATPAAAHQLCHSHLGRELKAFDEAHPQEDWHVKIKTLFNKANELSNGPHSAKQIKRIENKLEKLLQTDQSLAPGKISAFWKRLNKHKDKIFTFLYDPKVPRQNNASERAIRCAKVKLKVSGQFKTTMGAQQFVIIRSLIDTMIKQKQNVHEGLARIASLAPG